MNKLLFRSLSMLFLPIEIFLLLSCEEYGGHHQLSNEYKIAFSLHDTLIYENQQGEKEAYYISMLERGKLYFGAEYNSTSEFESIGICPLGDTLCVYHEEDDIHPEQFEMPECKNCMTIYKQMSNPEWVEKEVIEDPALSWKGKWTQTVGSNDETRDQVILNGKRYQYVYIFNTNIIEPNYTITQIYFNYRIGFVGFKTKKGNVWNLVTEP